VTASWPELEGLLTDLRFAEIATAESTRVLYVLPRDLDRARGLVKEHGCEQFITVIDSPYVPEGMWFLADHQAIKAAFGESMQHMYASYPFGRWR
jgi:hypothetical protein